MKTLIGLVLVAMALGVGVGVRGSGLGPRVQGSGFGVQSASEPGTPNPGPVTRFSYLDIYLDSHEIPLAAYEFELTATSGDAKFVGVEGGDHRGFQNPPYYDQNRMQYQRPARIIIGAYSLGDDLPKGKMRVARVSVACEGAEKPSFAVRVIAAGAKDGGEIPAEATFVEGAAQ